MANVGNVFLSNVYERFFLIFSTFFYVFFNFSSQRLLHLWLAAVVKLDSVLYGLCVERACCKVMLGGAWFNECIGDIDGCDVDCIVDTAVSVVSRHLGIRDTPTTVIPNILKVGRPLCVSLTARSLCVC